MARIVEDIAKIAENGKTRCLFCQNPAYFSFCSSAAICRFRRVTSPPIRPVSFAVSDRQPSFSTRSKSPSSPAISYFIFSSSVIFSRSIFLCFAILFCTPFLCTFSLFRVWTFFPALYPCFENTACARSLKFFSVFSLILRILSAKHLVSYHCIGKACR